MKIIKKNENNFIIIGKNIKLKKIKKIFKIKIKNKKIKFKTLQGYINYFLLGNIKNNNYIKIKNFIFYIKKKINKNIIKIKINLKS